MGASPMQHGRGARATDMSSEDRTVSSAEYTAAAVAEDVAAASPGVAVGEQIIEHIREYREERIEVLISEIGIYDLILRIDAEVSSLAAAEAIAAGIAVQQVVASAAGEIVVAAATFEAVIAGVSVQNVISVSAVERVAGVAAKEAVVSSAGEHGGPERTFDAQRVGPAEALDENVVN